MGIKVNASAELTVAKLNKIVKGHSISKNIHNSVGPIQMDRWGNFEFRACSTEGVFHDCGGTIRVVPTGPRECVVEFVSDQNKCDREGHTAKIEEDLQDKLNEYWYD